MKKITNILVGVFTASFVTVIVLTNINRKSTTKNIRVDEIEAVGINCLYDLLYLHSANKPDNGGCWNVNTPTGSTLTEIVIDSGGEEIECNSNPCLDIATFGCGQYIFEYIYISKTCLECADTSYMTINIACCQNISGFVTCN